MDSALLCGTMLICHAKKTGVYIYCIVADAK